MNRLFVFTVSASMATTVLAHHSDAGLDMESFVTFDGIVSEFSWRNPHVYIGVTALDENGEPVEWAIQTSSVNTSARMGWSRDSLTIGERVTATVHPDIDGRPYGLLEAIEKADGSVLGSTFFSTSGEPRLAVTESDARATSLEGIWLADSDKLVDYPGGFDGFFRTEMSLNEKGRAAQAAYDELSMENPESTCVGRPTPGMILSTVVYPIQIVFQPEAQTITLRSEFFDDFRTVYMDGRSHPDGSVRVSGGHSIGRWEDDVLVVDTRNFEDHRSPYQIGVPSGAQKHVVERFRLIDDGARAIIEFTLEDPEFLAAPLYHAREMIYSPQMTLSSFDCDEASTSRFVPR
ncbi:MAG: DUF6152 family protein [Gammaproteobacteria bacterium]